jgi:L-2-hydroxyglutarate oxidase LhgO
MDSYSTDAIVVGAGVIGLAAARAMALAGHDVVVLEQETLIGSHTSARNSEVIHAGIYYPQGSLKARLCVEGKRKLYDYCAARGVSHRRCGKLIVATSDSQVPELEAILGKAEANGVEDMSLLDADAAVALEPALSCRAALLSSSTGIIDSHGLMLALQGEMEDAGGMLAFGTRADAIEATGDGFQVRASGDGQETRISCRVLINAAGLFAPGIARMIGALDPAHVPEAHYCKGNYYSLEGRAPFDRLIYPVPEAAGLGVHLTLDLGGQARFGPDTEWVDGIDYTVDPSRADGFYAAIRRYWPDLREGSLHPAYAGIRPKLGGPDAPAADFRIDGTGTHGVPGLVNLLGIESPGLTSSLAIADEILARLDA